MNNPTTQKMVDIIATDQELEPTRGYLGMSSIGHECMARNWLDFRLASLNSFPGSTLCKFDDGYYSEDLTATRLKSIPEINLVTTTPNHKQIEVTAVDGHFKGHLDGLIRGIVQDPEGEYVWEHKCSDPKIVSKLSRLIEKEGEHNALAAWNNNYYIQAQLYMHFTKTYQHFLTVSTSGSREYIELITYYDSAIAEKYIIKAAVVIYTDEMPEKISENADYYLCRMCNHNEVCHNSVAPVVTCRTCIFSKVEAEGGKWQCEKHGEEKDFDGQKAACDDHLFIPSILDSWAIQIDFNDDEIVYETRDTFISITNGVRNGSWTSQELREATLKHYNFESDYSSFIDWLEDAL